MAKSPIKRVAASRTPAPLILGAPAPHLDEPATPGEIIDAVSEAAIDALRDPDPEPTEEPDPEQPAVPDPNDVVDQVFAELSERLGLATPAAGEDLDIAQQMTGAAPVELTPAEYMLYSMTEQVLIGQAAIAANVAQLTDAIRIVGTQQQWTTDTIAGLHSQFQGMMAGGNPLKMISAMLGGKGPKVNPNGG